MSGNQTLARAGQAEPASFFAGARFGLLAAAILSGVINILMLTGPLFMLQVYDRVLASHSVPTLVTLLVMVMALYAMMAVLDFLRARVLSRIAHWIDTQLSAAVYTQWIERQGGGAMPGYRPLSDLSNIRGVVSSPVFIALFDLPWFPIYLVVVYVLHVQLGHLATAGAVVVIAIAFLNEWLTSSGIRKATTLEVAEARFSDEALRTSDSISAMGMTADTASYWKGLRNGSLQTAQGASERAELLSSLSKVFRLFLQSAILALGAYLTIQGEITAGAIVAASILAGRALAPIDQMVGGWKQLKRARLAHHRLKDFLARSAAGPSKAVLRLPDPKLNLSLDRVTKFAPAAASQRDRKPIVSNLSFALSPGDGLGVIGPSGSGKTSLGKLLVGLWTPDQGSLRLDGATFEQWSRAQIGPHIGYLPQSIELLSGTIAQNIGRFQSDAKHEDIVEAAKLADVHEMILSLPDGYGTSTDSTNTPLTGGQRQRIALARAIFRKPKLIVLDEPNSNLDAEGDAALAGAITKLRASGSIVIVMAHRPSAIAAVDKILMLKDGQCVEFGEKTEVLRKVTRAA